MSDRYVIDLKCAFCKKINKQIFYNAEWADTFKCEECGKTNYIRQGFKAYKIDVENHTPKQ